MYFQGYKAEGAIAFPPYVVDAIVDVYALVSLNADRKAQGVIQSSSNGEITRVVDGFLDAGFNTILGFLIIVVPAYLLRYGQ